MKPASAVCAAALLVTLAGCDEPKPRPAPPAAAPAPAATPPAPAAPAAPAPKVVAGPIAPSTVGLVKRDGLAGFYVEHVGAADDPMNKQPAQVAGDQPITIGGFGFDAVTRKPGKGLDLVIDGKAYGTTYGASRPDVAAFYKSQALTAVGYAVTFPAGTFAKGEHTLLVRVALLDGRSYQDSVPIKFQVR